MGSNKLELFVEEVITRETWVVYDPKDDDFLVRVSKEFSAYQIAEMVCEEIGLEVEDLMESMLETLEVDVPLDEFPELEIIEGHTHYLGKLRRTTEGGLTMELKNIHPDEVNTYLSKLTIG